jgi:hypothetical protein
VDSNTPGNSAYCVTLKALRSRRDIFFKGLDLVLINVIG